MAERSSRPRRPSRGSSSRSSSSAGGSSSRPELVAVGPGRSGARARRGAPSRVRLVSRSSSPARARRGARRRRVVQSALASGRGRAGRRPGGPSELAGRLPDRSRSRGQPAARARAAPGARRSVRARPARASGPWWATPSGAGWPARPPAGSTRAAPGPRPPGARSMDQARADGRARPTIARQIDEWVRVDEVRDEATSAVARGVGRPTRAGRRAGTDELEDEIRRRAGRLGRRRPGPRGSSSGCRRRPGPSQAERYTDAARILRKLAEEAPGVAAVRELYGLTLYRQGKWRAGRQGARGVPPADRLDRAAPGAGRLLPGPGRRRHGRRAVGRAAQASPSAELVVEGRIVVAGIARRPGRPPRRHPPARAGWSLPRRPQEHHLRRGYALADLYERAGDVARARELFERLAAVAPDFADVAPAPSRPWADPPVGRPSPVRPGLRCDAPTLADQTGPPVPDRRAARLQSPAEEWHDRHPGPARRRGRQPAHLRVQGHPREDLTLPGPDIVDRVYQDSDRSPQVLRNLAGPVRPRPPGRHRLRVDPAGRPGHRALGGGLVRAQPQVLRPEEHRRAGHRGRLQRGGHHLRRARAVLAPRTPTASPSSSSSTTTSC